MKWLYLVLYVSPAVCHDSWHVLWLALCRRKWPSERAFHKLTRWRGKATFPTLRSKTCSGDSIGPLFSFLRSNCYQIDIELLINYLELFYVMLIVFCISESIHSRAICLLSSEAVNKSRFIHWLRALNHYNTCNKWQRSSLSQYGCESIRIFSI